jgi:hypothetical protein
MSDCCAVVRLPVSRLDVEALELLKHGFRKYFLVGFDCPKCGCCRSELAFPPEKRIDCPRCQTSCPARLWMIGFTRREALASCEVWEKPIDISKLYLRGLGAHIPKPIRRNLLTRGQRAPEAAQIAR